MELHLRPLTPLWTGDAEAISGELKITGLMGSLRWWFEAIARAMDRYACDPTEGGCKYDPSQKPLHGLCPACWLFGATSWARRFRLTASGLHASDWYVLSDPAVGRLHENWLRRVYKPGSKVLWGDTLALRIQRYFPGCASDFDIEGILCGLLNVVARLSAIGAKPQNGFGVVEWQENPAFDRHALRSFVRTFSENGGDTEGMFNLAETTFLHFTVPNPGLYATASAVKIPAGATADYASHVLPLAYDVRYKSRAKHFRTGAGEDRGLRPLLNNLLKWQAEEIVGSAARSADRSGSRVFVSHLYRHSAKEPYRMRIWVHVPSSLSGKRQQITETIRTFILKDMFPGSTCEQYGWAEVQKEVL